MRSAAIEQRQVFRIARALQLFYWDEAQRGGIDAVAQAGGTRAVLEDVTEVGVSSFGAHPVRDMPKVLSVCDTTRAASTG